MELARRDVDISNKTLKSFVVVGGVAANESIRNNLKKISKKMNYRCIFPSKEFCPNSKTA